MSIFQKRCWFCEGINKIDIVNPISKMRTQDADCPVCDGKGYLKINMYFYEFNAWDFRYFYKGKEDGSL